MNLINLRRKAELEKALDIKAKRHAIGKIKNYKVSVSVVRRPLSQIYLYRMTP